LTPTDTDLTQLWQALQIAPWIQEYGVDTGSANVYSASITPVPTQLYVGMTVAIKIGNANTGASTLNICGLGAHAIKRATGADINSGDLRSGQIAAFVFDGAYWQMINFLGFQSDTTVNNFTLKIPFSTDTGAANAIVGIFNPHITLQSAGDPYLIKVMNTNTGPVSVKMDALPAVQLIWPDQSQLAAGDIITGGLIFCVFDGTKLQLLCRINGGGGGGPPPPTTGVPGTIDLWPTDTPPAGAYECNGQALSRVNDARLFGIIGTRYGSPDPNTFNVPDFRGQFIRGWSHGSGVDPDANTRTDRGDGTAGDHVGTKQTDAVRSHSHAAISGGMLDLDFGGPMVAGRPTNPAQGWDTTSGHDVSMGPFPGLHGPPWGGGVGTQLQVGQGQFDYVNKITNIKVSGSALGTQSTGGNETRPTNINMMAIIWR
jgi:hypothetical protein